MIGDITFNGILDGSISGSEGSVVTVTPIQVTGNLIAKISVDGTNYNIYSPIVSGSDVSVTPALLSGTLVGTITVDGVDYQLYAPESGDHVTVTNTLLTGTRIATISINGTSKDLFVPPSGDVVNFYPNLESGELIGRISINGVSQQLYAPTPTDVDVTSVLSSGTKIGTIAVDNTDYDLYAPNPTDVDITPVLSSGTKIGTIAVDNTDYDLYAPNPTSVSVIPTLESGTKIGTITVNGSNVDLYAPTPVRTASGISYDNTSSGMTADDVQEAVDELKSNLTQKTEWHRVINELVGTGTTYDQTLNMTMPDYTPNEIMFCLMKESNGRTFATSVIPYAQWVNGAIYTSGEYTLYSGQMTSANIYLVNAVCIYVSSTQCEIALQPLTESVRVRVFVR